MPRPLRGQAAVIPVCLVDENHKRYTTAVMATESDWWWGATILTRPEGVQRLLDAGRTLSEVDPATGRIVAKVTGVRGRSARHRSDHRHRHREHRGGIVAECRRCGDLKALWIAPKRRHAVSRG